MHPVINKTIISPAKIISLGLDVDVVIILLPIHINHFQNIRGNLRQIILLKHTEHQYISPSAFDGFWRRLAAACDGLRRLAAACGGLRRLAAACGGLRRLATACGMC
jgi:hypothetical protein